MFLLTYLISQTAREQTFATQAAAEAEAAQLVGEDLVEVSRADDGEFVSLFSHGRRVEQR